MGEEQKIVCRLSVQNGADEKSVLVGDKPVILGRASDSDLVLSDESVSRHHAQVRRDGDTWLIADLGSKNGVKVNTYRAVEKQLFHGDRIDLGSVRLHVDIQPYSPTAEARVVFDKEQERGLRTEIIEMDQLGSLLSSFESVSGRALSEMRPRRGPRETTPPGESAELLPLFGAAAEALLSCETLDQTLERILALVFDNLPAERGVICLYDEETDTTEPKVMRTRDGVPETPITISSNIVNDVIKRKQSLLVQDTRADERFGGADSVMMLNIMSAMCAPLYRDGRVVGFIYIDRQSSKHPFNATHLQTLSTLAILSAVGVEQTALRDEIRHEQELRSRLARYSSPAVVDRILEAGGGAAQTMVAEESEVTVLFADLTGFTSLAEKLDASEVVQMLNRVFERLTEVIFEFEGTLDKFRGDGLMAFFGAPLALPDHAARAVSAALRMQEVLDDVNSYSDAARRVSMRIGINSGSAVAGDIGSPQRKDYTVIGDTVNTASRLESSVAKPGQVVIGASTYEQVRELFQCEALEEVTLKGKRKPVRPYVVKKRIEGPKRG
ncbi:MAG: FHA domain-containing protein [Proteobacteria bacterium]|nr:FHA domain-containing protein [Pseudomonadota bacterium]